MSKKFFLVLLTVFVLVLTTGCGIVRDKYENDKSRSTDVKIEKDKAKEIGLELRLGAGELNVSSGADEWVEGTIEYNNDRLKPDVSYVHIGDKGTAVIKQGKFKTVGKLKNKWDLTLNNQVPINLIVNSGASETKLDLTGLKLSGLDVNAGVGDITIDLSGKWKESFDVSLEMGVGQSTIILPADVGVKIKSTKGIGSVDFVDFISKGNGVYVNEAYENADVIINVRTELGVGESTFTLK